MFRTAITTCVLAVLIAPRSARADDVSAARDASPDKVASSEPPSSHFDAEPSVALPMGNLANATGPALGALIGGGHMLDDRWEFVGHVGYLAGTSTSTQVGGVSVSSSLSYAPLLGGVRYYLADPDAVRLYLSAEAGVVAVSGSATAASGGLTSATDSGPSIYFGSIASLGLQLGIVDLRAGLLTADLGHPDTSTSALLTLGFRFASY